MLKIILSFFLFITILCGSTQVYAESAHPKVAGPKTSFSKDEVSTVTGGAISGDDSPIYMQLPPLNVPFINDKGAQQIVSLLIDLHIDTVENAEKLKSNDPILKDALFVAMYAGLSDGAMRNAHALDILKIKQLIKDTVNEIFGSNIVLNVLVQGVAQRKL